MSADPCAVESVGNTPPEGPPTPSYQQGVIGSSNGAAGRDIASLRAAALKSAAKKKVQHQMRPGSSAAVSNKKQARPALTDGSGEGREDGEISDDDDSRSPPPRSIAGHVAGRIAQRNRRQTPPVVRSTVVTISNESGEASASSPSSISKEEEAQYLEILRNLLLHDGIAPEVLVRKGAPSQLVTRACQEIVASKNRRRDLWMRPRSPVLDGSETPTAPNSERGGALSRSPSPDIEVAVSSGRPLSPSSESSNEDTVDRMVAQQPPPRIVPSSSWTPQGGRPTPLIPAPLTSAPRSAIHIDTYRPLSRPPVPPLQGIPKPLVPPGPAPKSRQRRDIDRAPQGAPDVLNYGDDDSSNSSTNTPPAEARTVPDPPAHAQAHATASGPDISETRRRVLESMRRRKNAASSSSTSGTPTVAQTPPPQSIVDEASKLEREILGSTAEVPMEIDDDVEEGEIEEKTPSPPPPLPAPVPIPVSRSHSRGVKRPLAEDMMDNPSRPTSAQRMAPKRRTFGALPHQRPGRLIVSLDDSDESDSSDDEEPAPAIHTPIIVIPPPLDKATAIAEKEERIRRLKEQIEAKLALQRASASSAPSGAATPTTDSRVAEATKAAAGVGGVGVAPEDVDAAVEAIVEDEEAARLEDSNTQTSISEPSSARSPKAPHTSTVASHFQPYQPLLPHYPQLAASSSKLSATPASPHSPPHPSTDMELDWGLLSSIILTRRLQVDPTATMCRSEAAGGRCADAACSDVHLVRTTPTDADLVAYLSQVFASQSSSNDDYKPDPEVVATALKLSRLELERGKHTLPSDASDTTALTILLDLTARRLQARAR